MTKKNQLLNQDLKKNLKELDDLTKGYWDPELKFPERTLWDDVKFKIGLYKGLIKHKLDLY